jgi:tryptophan synthase beta chain
VPSDVKVLLEDRHIPKFWYNILADLPWPLPPVIHPATRKPVSPEDLLPLFPESLIAQEGSQERWVPIPEEVRGAYALWRPTPLYRARRLEKLLDTPARIYFKYEACSPTGSHKPNTAVAQAFFNRVAGVRRLTTETGAGQWGSALAFACRLFELACKVYMVKVSYQQKPYRRVLMESWGAQVVPSPSPDTDFGRKVLAQDPEHPGSLGIAISEAVEDAASREDTKYSLGSVLNHVLLHQTVIGEEARLQMEMVGEYPDVVVGCVGGGSNFAGLAFPFLRDRLAGKSTTRFIAVEPTACPSLTHGEYAYDFGDTAGRTPLLKMHTLGHQFVPPRIHAGGLRYHGMAPLVSLLVAQNVVEARAVPQRATFDAALTFAHAAGFIPAPETAHAIRVVIDEALAAKEAGQRRCILFNFSGHGLLDLQAYEEHLSGTLQDWFFSKPVAPGAKTEAAAGSECA